MNWGISTYYKGERVYIDLYGYGSTEKKAIICADREDAMQEADRRCRLYMTKNGLGIGRFYFGSKGYHTLECWEKKLAQKKEPLLERLKSVVFPMPEVPIRQYIELSLSVILTFLRTSLSSKVLHKSVIIILTIILLTF